MKLMKRTGIYKASNVSFDPSSVEAFSYGWWNFVRKINGAVVFNNYSYSSSTSKHQSKVWRQMDALGIKIDLFVKTACDLRGYLRYGQSADAGREALKEAYRVQDFARAEKIQRVFKVKMSQAEIAALYVSMEEKLCDAFLERSVKRQEKLERERFLAMHRKLEQYLENEVCFRDYEIFHKDAFGDAEHKAARIVAVHQVVDEDSLENDVENAIQSFSRDGFGKIVFYVGGAQ